MTETSGRLVLALAGDTMLGRGVGRALVANPRRPLACRGVAEALAEADLFVVNLECCISARGKPWPSPGKPFFFRAPPAAAEALARLGVDCVTLANNHALDFGAEGLCDTFDHLEAVGIRWAGAGPDLNRARAPVWLEARNFRLAVVAATDHPPDFAAGPDRPGVAFMDLRDGPPEWLEIALTAATQGADGVLFAPHWGPNRALSPRPHVRRAARDLGGRATLVAGHSAHVFHGVEGNVLYDMGDFVNDYHFGLGALPAAVRARLAAPRPALELYLIVRRKLLNLLHPRRTLAVRPHFGLLFLVTLDGRGPLRLEALPLRLEHAFTRLARGSEAAWIRGRFRQVCAAEGTLVEEEGNRLVVTWPRPVSDEQGGGT